ncbi:MAG: cation:proton antiporter [Rhodobacter sp.]|nr:cation:proton antiporter [Rhodobacter sp.]MCA3512915.1 cation:proton antiporter [Rhodobacter sp.]MCA3519097.1 cation:proton antiporter [Rhodobacter sp.]MCA3524369.1 cation:proton antiporter [Rhodobacter sp.]MCA3529214.1 cation:proton antiporter [Rhodobacter sp.]
MDLAVLLGVLAALFIFIGSSGPLAEWLRLPVTVILAATGIAIGAAASFFWFTDLTDALNPVALAILRLPISSDVFLLVFLPTLIFHVSLTIDLRRMLDDWVPILVLAVVAVGVATVMIGLALLPFAGLPLMACLLIGAIVSTTDPSAVVSIFRSTPAPQRLARIVEGESLLNDAAAIALFGIFVGFLTAGADPPSLAGALASFPWLVAAGALLGWALARGAVALMARLGEYPLGQISVSLAVPYAAFILADEMIRASGVIAVVAAGLTVNMAAPGRMSPPAFAKLTDTWDLLAYWSGSLIFMLAAILIPRLLAELQGSDFGLILVTVLAALAARAVVLFGLLPLLTLARVSPRVERPYRLAILWGGLRGAVTLALALAVTESAGIPPEVKRQVGILATGFTLFTLLVQGTTLRLVIGWLGLDRLSPLDRALSSQVVAVALQSVRETVAGMTRDFGLQRSIVRDEAKRFAERLDRAVAAADEGEPILDRERVALGLVALAGQERDLILDAFCERLMPARLADRMLTEADRMIEATRTGGRSGYRARSRSALRQGRLHRAAVVLHNRLGLSGPLQRLTAERFEMIVALRLILSQLHGFIDSRILRIHGRRVADLLHELLVRRGEDVQKELEALRLQYPGYADEMERRVIRRTALQLELAEYDQLTQDGLIGPELRSDLMKGLSRRWRDLDGRPDLDLAVQKSELVQLFPLFESMPREQRLQLERQLRTVYAAPGDVLLRREEMPRKVWFIASGAVEAVQAGQKHLLGRGEMFGQLAVVLGKPRKVQFTAISHCTLLTLDEVHFLALLHRNEALLEAIRQSAERRGVKIDLQELAATPPARRKARWWRPSAAGKDGRKG